MTNPLLRAAGITPYTKNRSAEWALFEGAWKCVCILRYAKVVTARGMAHACCLNPDHKAHTDQCPLVAFDEAVKNFQELEQKS
jgi:hypothetical protein